MVPSTSPSDTHTLEQAPLYFTPTTGRLPDLPAEIILSIFELVLDDRRESPLAQRKSARRLSRVCRRWNSCVRSKGLPLVVASAGEAIALSKLLSHGRSRANSDRPAPQTAKRMVLLAPRVSTGVGAAFAKVLKAASALEEVEIRLGSAHWGRDFDPLGVPVRTALQRLDLRSFEVVAERTVFDVRHFAELLASWPELQVLKCACFDLLHASVYSEDQPARAAFPVSFPPNLHTLHLGSEVLRYMNTAMMKLFRTPSGSRLRNLCLINMPLLQDDFPPFLNALGQVAPHLRSLTLIARHRQMLHEPPLSIDVIFPRLTSAVALHLDLRILNESTVLSSLLPLVLQHALRVIFLAPMVDWDDLSNYTTRLRADDMLDFLAGVRPGSGASRPPRSPLRFILVGQISQAWTRQEIATVKEVADREGSGIELYLA